MAKATLVLLNNGKKTIINWFGRMEESEVDKFHPVTQAYGICFNDEGEIMILNQASGRTWTLPGGTVEPGETLRQTLVREVMEEADIILDRIYFVGLQSVESDSGLIYQSRFAAHIKEVLPQTPDPDKGRIHPRKFVKTQDVTKFVRWGKTGRAMFKDAISVYLNYQNQTSTHS